MGAFVLFIFIAIIWGVVSASKRSPKAYSGYTSQKFNQERSQKFTGRIINKNLTLFERNKDIIESFKSKVTLKTTENYSNYLGRGSYRNRHSYSGYYYFDNLVRDCLNEIALAENRADVYPGAAFLSSWRGRAPAEWQNLSKQIEQALKDKKANLEFLEKERQKKAEEALQKERERERQIKVVENEVWSAKKNMENLKKKKEEELKIPKIQKQPSTGAIFIEEIEDVLIPNIESWTEKEKKIIYFNENFEEHLHFSIKENLDSIKELNKEIDEYNSHIKLLVNNNFEFALTIKNLLNSYKKGLKEAVEKRIDYIISNIDLPRLLPKIWDVEFEPEQHIAIVEVGLPDIVHNPVYKKVQLKTGTTIKQLNQKETREKVPSLQPAIILRMAYEIFRNDTPNVIKLLVLNGWVKYNDPATGKIAKTYTASLAVEREQIEGLNLSKLEPLSAFLNLKGKSAGKLIDIIPVTPMLSLDRKDKRIIETKEVLGKLDNQTNLASMDWQDFENLIAELFEKEFSEEGTEIKLTQSSRDKGVDAIVFNPDPIRGGKYVIQAKRYTNTVDVSAVRDLVAVVAHEGASRGILVTTSSYGSDAYAFVQNKPITLLDGSKLLGLLQKHGYKFRINVEEARKLYPSHQKY